MGTEFPINNLTALLDQADGVNADLACHLGSFYGKLKSEGLPDQLAGDIILTLYAHLLAVSHDDALRRND